MEWLVPVLIVVGVILLAGIYLWATYNSLVQLKVRVDEAWSGITVQLKRRADLIPNPSRRSRDTPPTRRRSRERDSCARRDAVGRRSR